MTDTERNLLSPLSTEQLRAMLAKAEAAAANHAAALRLHMAQLCADRAAACRQLLTERGAYPTRAAMP